MKHKTRFPTIVLAAATLLAGAAMAGDDAPAAAAQAQAEDQVAFLGVATRSVEPAVAEHFDLPEGVGLVVEHVVKDSAAKGELQAKDLLHKFDGQLLTSPRHLAILVRSKAPGDEAAIDYLRKGEERKATIKLGAGESRPLPGDVVQQDAPGILFDVPGLGAFFHGGPDMNALRQEMEQAMQLALEQAGPLGADLLDGVGEELEQQIDELLQDENFFNFEGPKAFAMGGRASMSMNTQGADGIQYTYTLKNDDKRFKALSPGGKVLFDGPVNTDADKAKVPANLKDQLARMEKNTRVGGRGAMQFQFNLGDFGGLDGNLDIEKLPGVEMLFPKADAGQERQAPAQPAPRAVLPRDGVVSIIDDELTVSLSERDGSKHCKALGKDGEVMFDGPIDTEEQRKDLPDEVRSILEDMQALETK